MAINPLSAIAQHNQSTEILRSDILKLIHFIAEKAKIEPVELFPHFVVLPDADLAGVKPNDWVSTEVAARIVGLARKTLEGFRHKKAGPTYRKRGRRVEYRVRDLRRWDAQRAVADIVTRRTA